MQPLISVDHELRQNSHRVDETAITSNAEENTPLLHRFPQHHAVGERNPFTTIIVSLLLTILIAGVVIGIYLLVLQSNSENILPPVETPLRLVSRKQWDRLADSTPILSSSPLITKQVVVVQTDTEQCLNTASCKKILRALQANITTGDKLLPYNFLVASNGQTYEALGWHKPSRLFDEYPNALVLAFIGNFTEVSPVQTQIEAAKNFFTESVSQRHLDLDYDIIGRTIKTTPTHLFNSLKLLPQWNEQLSDV